MKTFSHLPIITIVITGLILTNCNSSKKNITNEDSFPIKETKQITLETQEVSGNQKFINSDYEKFIQEAKARIRRNEYKYLRLISKTNLYNSGKNVEVLKGIDKLNVANLNCKLNLDAYINNGKGNWKVFKEEFYDELNQLEEQYSEVAFNDRGNRQ